MKLAVTTVGPLEFDGNTYGMVLDQSGTVDRDQFLRRIKGLSEEEMESMDHHFPLPTGRFACRITRRTG